MKYLKSLVFMQNLFSFWKSNRFYIFAGKTNGMEHAQKDDDHKGSCRANKVEQERESVYLGNRIWNLGQREKERERMRVSFSKEWWVRCNIGEAGESPPEAEAKETRIKRTQRELRV